MTAPAGREYRGLPLGELLEEVSSAEPMPGAGYCAAVTLEMAAGLVAMAARASRADWGEGRGAAAQATTLRERIAPLAERNVNAYREAVALLGGGGSAGGGSAGDESLRDALTRAAGVPLEIAEVAVDVAALAAVVAERGDQAMRADAVSAALLAEAAARAAATLVEVNLGTTSSDERVARARDLAGSATAAAQRARHTLV
jgi:formiminotetrahydrofolate cyclodeaminase